MPWVTFDDLVKLWRSLPSSFENTALAWTGVVERRIVAEYPGIAERVGTPAGPALDDVKAAVVALVAPVLEALQSPHPGAKSWSATSGAESRSVSLGETPRAQLLDLIVFTDAIRALLDPPVGTAVATSAASFPDAYPVERLFGW